MKKDKDKEKKSPGLIARAIISLIGALVVVIFLNIRNSRYSISGELGWYGLTGWAWTVFCIAIFFGVFAFFFFFVTIKKKESEKRQLTEEEKKIKRKKKLTIIFLIISLLATIGYVYYNYDQLVLWGLAKAIPAIALFFGLVFMAFELFSFIKPSIFDGLVRLPWSILMKVVVPMMPFVIILLGIMQAWYPTNYPFLDETAKGLRSAFFTAGAAFQKVVALLYNLGLQNPTLWFALTIGAFIVMLYLVVREIFVEEEPDEDNIPMDELIKKVIEEDKEKEERKKELEKGDKKRWDEKLADLFTSEKTREKEKEEEIEDTKANSKVVRYHIDLKKD